MERAQVHLSRLCKDSKEHRNGAPASTPDQAMRLFKFIFKPAE